MNMRSTPHVPGAAGTPVSMLVKSAVCVALIAGVGWMSLMHTAEVRRIEGHTPATLAANTHLEYPSP
jgi:hypothetical protein